MNDYLKTFENINQSVEPLLTDERISLEIKQSATSLKKSVQPCFEELKQSASKLKRLVLACSDELYQAENVWLSKPRIAETAKQDIWEQLGEVSGRHFKIRILVSQCEREAVTQAKESWEEIVNRLKKTWFIDAKGQTKKGVGWNEKEGFLIGIRYEINYFQSQGINLILKKNLDPIYQEIKNISLESVQSCLIALDEETKTKLSHQMELIVKEIEDKFSNPAEYVPNQSKRLKDTVGKALEALANKAWGDITWEEVVNFKNEISSKIGNHVTSIFDDRVQLATQSLEQVIAFYNDFLERQERYQQETPEQREAEKAWIDQQRRELARVQEGIEAILIAD